MMLPPSITHTVPSRCRDADPIRSRPLSFDAGPAPRVLFVGKLYAGHRTRFLNLRARAERDPRIRPRYRTVSGWVDGGRIERLPLLPRGWRGRLRGATEAAAVLEAPRPDVIWTSAGEVVAPFLLAQSKSRQAPLVLDLDWTLEQQESIAPDYFGRPPKRGLRRIVARIQEQLLWQRVTLFTPWSTWAADSLRRQGVPDQRILVLPPGIDLDQWRPPTAGRHPQEGPLRLLFVGGDFRRKGGDILLAAIRTALRGRCELDIVTRDPVEPAPGVRIHRAEPNSELLRRLYAEADVFVMPSRAECFGIATIEAMASGLPVIVGDVGGVRDIVQDGETGWLVRPNLPALIQALENALAYRSALPEIGDRGRRRAKSRFDGRQNDTRVVDLLVQLAEIPREQHGGSTATAP